MNTRIIKTGNEVPFLTIFMETQNLQLGSRLRYSDTLSQVSSKFDVPNWQVEAIDAIGRAYPLLLRSNSYEFDTKQLLRLLRETRRPCEILSVNDKEQLRAGGLEWLKAKFKNHGLSEPYFFAKHLKLYPIMDEYAFDVLWTLLKEYYYVKEPEAEIVLPKGDCIYENTPDGLSLFNQDTFTAVLKRFMLKNIPVPLEILGAFLHKHLFFRDLYEKDADMGDEYLNCYYDGYHTDAIWEMMIGYDVVRNVHDGDEHQLGASINQILPL